MAGALIGALIGFGLASHLPVVPSTLLSALTLAGGASLSGRLRQPLHWWALIGAATGTLLGTACVLATLLQQSGPEQHLDQRAITVLILAAAGAIAGHSLSNSPLGLGGRQPRDLLRSASALTTGVFGAIVTLTFIHSGLDPARTFSSRLSTSLTILVTALAAPGWLSHLLTQRQHHRDDS
jgi:drug/metabolite transporter (DMT)-like permease